MSELLDKLFSNPNFPFFLGLIIAILLVLFCVVFILGKKDQRIIEETMRLDTLAQNSFAENTTPVPLEIAVPINEEQVVSPDVYQTQSQVEEPPVISDNASFEQIIPEPSVVIAEEKVQEVNDITYEQAMAAPIPNYSHLTEELDKEISSMEKGSLERSIDEKIKELEMLETDPIINETPFTLQDTSFNDEIILPPSKPKMEIFSSVYAPSNNDNMMDDIEDDVTMQLPKLKD